MVKKVVMQQRSTVDLRRHPIDLKMLIQLVNVSSLETRDSGIMRRKSANYVQRFQDCVPLLPIMRAIFPIGVW